MELFKSLTDKTKSYDVPFNHFELNEPLTDEAIKGNKYKLSTTDIQMIKDNLMEVKAYEEFHEDTQEENKEVFKS